MSEWFEITVAVGVWLAALVFVVQAIMAIALFRRLGKVQDKLTPMIERAVPVFEKLEPMLTGAMVMMEKATPALEKAGPVIEKIGPVVEKIGPVLARAEQVLASAGRVIEDSRPKISEVSSQVVEIAKSGREQVDRLGTLLHDAGDRARERLEQIDRSVEATVGQVEEVGGTVKRAVMRPVLAVNGVAAGISAAVSTLFKGSRKPSGESATQDEEMFI